MLAKPTKLWSPNEFSMSIPKATYRKEYGEYGSWYYNNNNNNNNDNNDNNDNNNKNFYSALF